MKLVVSNTFTRTKEAVVPQLPGEISLYVCGITPYSYSHIGHARVYITFDVLHRLLKAQGVKVTYIRNFTDVEDKILDRIPQPHSDIESKIKVFVDPFIADYHAGLKALNCLPATHEPRVTQTIPEVIDLVSKLIARGHAYVLCNSVYFDVASYPEYGKLSGHPLENLLCGSRIDVDDDKKNPGDFALWKGNDEQLYWQSPWGHGRPGWHIECSAMVGSFTKTLDIHGGGADLLFPHHENERAQSEAGYGCQLSRYWMHVEFLLMNKEKMSKSLGNVMLMKDVLAQNNPMVFRFLMLQHSYNKQLSYSTEDLEAAGKAFDRLNDLLWSAPLLCADDVMKACVAQDLPFVSQALDAVQDDLNTAKVIALIFENIQEIKSSVHARSVARSFLEHVLGLAFAEPKAPELSPEIKSLIAEREQARKDHDWARSDALRDQLTRLGYALQDKKL